MGHGYASCDVAACYRHPDRETGLSCSECGRPICTDCVTFAPVGLRCPDHAGTRPRAQKAARTVQRPLARRGIVISTASPVTKILVVVNIVIYLINVVITFTWGSISKGGHVGGLIGGLACISVIVARGRFRATRDPVAIAGMVAIGIASIAIAYWKVRGLA